jgi:iron(III) transport system permease protein
VLDTTIRERLESANEIRSRPWTEFVVRWRRSLALFPLAIIVLALVGPSILLMLFTAFRTGGLLDADATFTLDNVRMVYTTEQFLNSLRDTLILAVCASLAATIVGSAFAWLITRTNVPFARTLETFVIAPLFISPFIGAIAWGLLGSSRVGFINAAARAVFGTDGSFINIESVPGMIWVMAVYYIPYGYLFVSGALRNMDPSLEESSAMNGAHTIRTALRITLPLVRPAILSAMFFVFILAASEFAIPSVLTPDQSFQPLSMQVYAFSQTYPISYGGAAATGTMLFILAIIGITLYRRSIGQTSRFVTVTARGYRTRRIPLGKWRWLGFVVCVLYLFVAIVLPYLTLVYVACTAFISPNILKAHYTFNEISNQLASPVVHTAIKNTLIVALVAPTACILLGLALAYVTQRMKIRGSALVSQIATLPVAIPGIVFGTGVLLAYVVTPLYGTVWLIAIAFVAIYLPQTLRIAETGLAQVHPALEEASTMCGAGLFRTLVRVTMPLIKPSLLASWILVFIFSVREIGAAVMLYGPDSAVLSVLTWDSLDQGDAQNAAILGLIQTVFMVIGIILARYVFRVKLTSSRVGGGLA